MNSFMDRAPADRVADAGAAAVRFKASFGEIYVQSDPRAYFRVLGDLAYVETAHMHRITATLLGRLATGRDRATVLDVCCSYGMLGMLLGTELAFDDLAHRYREASIATWSSRRLLEEDRDHLARHRRHRPPTVYGLDAAAEAVAYARAVGAVAQGFAEDLETHEPSRQLRRALGDVDLLAVAGGIGYVTERTLDRLLRHAPDQPPWVAALVSRVYPYDRIAAGLAAHGLVTERLTTRTFPRRRFVDAAEQEAAIAQLGDLGIDPTGREADGWYHADLYVSRPAADARTPINAALADL